MEENPKLDIKKLSDSVILVKPEFVENVKCEEVLNEEFYEMSLLGEKLIAKCVELGGAGLSAPQVGIKKSMFIWMFKPNLFQISFNPKWYPDNNKKINTVEGCLTYPGESYYVEGRYKYIRAVWYIYNKNNKKFTRVSKTLRDNAAIIFQHECQHCDGITIAMCGKKISRGKSEEKN